MTYNPTAGQQPRQAEETQRNEVLPPETAPATAMTPPTQPCSHSNRPNSPSLPCSRFGMKNNDAYFSDGSSRSFTSGSGSQKKKRGRASIELRKLAMVENINHSKNSSVFSSSAESIGSNPNIAIDNSNADDTAANTINSKQPQHQQGDIPWSAFNDSGSMHELDEREEDADEGDESAGEKNKGHDLKGTNRSKKRSKKEQYLCGFVRSRLTLQSQLLLSFGVVSAATLTAVLVVCIAVSVGSGTTVKHLTRDSLLRDQTYRVQATTVRYLAETLSQRLLPEDMIEILHSASIDRLVGYPNHPGYEQDNLTPFLDSTATSSDQQQPRRVYPVKGPRAILDGAAAFRGEDNSSVVLITPETAQEHVGDRYELYWSYANITTSHAAYTFPGVCNPSALEGDYDYYPNCTTSNNNIDTGGVVHPTTTNRHLYHRASDLTPLFKALYEQNPDIRDLGICFVNDGAGSTLTFPGYPTNHSQSYISNGCEWMKQPNPMKLKYNISSQSTIGTPEMIARCHPNGTRVYNREYNPLERPWCMDQAAHPDSIRNVGPFVDAWNPEHMLMLSGKALYDPLTKEFIGCLFVSFQIAAVQDMLRNDESLYVSGRSHVSIARWDAQGSVAASSAWNMSADISNSNPSMSDLKIGVTPELSQQLYDLVDYDAKWDPEEVRRKYATFLNLNEEEGYLVNAYPMPPVPTRYDPRYRPEFMVFMSVSTQDVLEPVERMDDMVDDTVEHLVYISLVGAAIGWGIVMLLIITVSKTLTLPLKSMHQVTKAIVKNFGGNSENAIQYASQQHALVQACTPDTEVMDVVREFQKMVEKFSGSSGMARAVQVQFTEVENHFSFIEEFKDLYRSRQDDDEFPYKYDESSFHLKPKQPQSKLLQRPVNRVGAVATTITSSRSKEPHRIHFGSILTGYQSHLDMRQNTGEKTSSKEPTLLKKDQEKRKRLTSPLFLWIVLWIVSPLLLTTVTLSAVVTFYVSVEYTQMIDDGKAEYLELEQYALKAAVKLRAEWIAATTERSIRDLHLVTRYAGWLLFGGLERRDSFTTMTTGANDCKDMEEPLKCPYLENFPCDCSWNSSYGQCFDSFRSSGSFDFRYMQETYFLCESHDTLADGDRYSSLSFPENSYSPSTTAWWEDVSTVPGAEKGSSAKGFDTTYDRLRVLSAIPVFQTLYNYDFERKMSLQSAVAMEADGMVVGYHGCALTGEAMSAFWESSITNGASERRPSLCPVGKFGYDPRCRAWYHSGRELAATENTHLYVAQPYAFATDSTFGQTCTSPIVDPITQEHAGQAFVDYKVEPVLHALNAQNTSLAEGGYPILISAWPGRDGTDAIVGPGFVLGKQPQSIDDLLLQYYHNCFDASCRSYEEEFANMLVKMRAGEHDLTAITVYNPAGGSSNENIFVAYAPVVARSYRPLDGSDFSRGVEMERYHIYFLALTEMESSVVARFEAVANDVHKTINIGIGVLCIAILLATAAVVYISYWVASSITEPMLYLLGLIRHINQLDDDAIHVGFDSRTGSREVKSVAHTMRTLHKIVLCANSAYFAGDIEKAYAVLTDSARLFERLGNRKAVGIANNNLGNTMLAMYRTMVVTGADTFCGLTKREIVSKGIAYFHQAIQSGEKAYEEFFEAHGWSPSCLAFMQHLSNRYFNRAMFLLTVKDDHGKPEELKELGMRDLQIARDMDVEIADQGTEAGWNVNSVGNLFSVALNRARGHLLLLELGYSDEWDIEELLEECFQTLQKEQKQKSTELFGELSAPGRMQQIEVELIRYKLWKGDLDCASKLAVRMLIEDEYTLPEAQLKAVEALLNLLEHDETKNHIREQLEQYASWLERAKARCDTSRADVDENTEEDVSQLIKMSMAKLQNSSSSDEPEGIAYYVTKQSSLLATTGGDVTMEVF